MRGLGMMGASIRLSRSRWRASLWSRSGRSLTCECMPSISIVYAVLLILAASADAQLTELRDRGCDKWYNLTTRRRLVGLYTLMKAMYEDMATVSHLGTQSHPSRSLIEEE